MIIRRPSKNILNNSSNWNQKEDLTNSTSETGTEVGATGTATSVAETETRVTMTLRKRHKWSDRMKKQTTYRSSHNKLNSHNRYIIIFI